MKNLRLLAFAALVLVMVVAACGGGGTAAKPTEGVSATTEATPGSQANATKVVAVQPTSEAAGGQATEESANLGTVSEGLAGLKSYKSSLSMRFSGTDASGQAVDNSWTMTEEFIANPPAQHVSWSSSESTGGQPPTVGSWESISVGQTAYWITTDSSGEKTCMTATSSEAIPSQVLSPDLWGNISDATFTGTETVNGVSAKHYVWNQSSILGWGFAGGKGETWVAVDGGYVVKQRIEATGKGVFLAGTDETGTTTWEWDLTDANGSFEITAPAGCESAASGMPMMADATDQSTFGDMITYNSASAFADVVSFYKAEMPKAGWQPSGTPTEMEGLASLEFAKEGSTATVLITWDDGKKQTSVVISVTKGSAAPASTSAPTSAPSATATAPASGGELRQWAISAVASSEYGTSDWAAGQATGSPDTLACGDQQTAWASSSSDTVDWIELQYGVPVSPSQVNILETYYPDQVVRVELRDPLGTYHIVYTGQPQELSTCPYTLSIPVQGADYLAVAVRITVDQSVVGQWNEIDAVELVGTVP